MGPGSWAQTCLSACDQPLRSRHPWQDKAGDLSPGGGTLWDHWDILDAIPQGDTHWLLHGWSSLSPGPPGMEMPHGEPGKLFTVVPLGTSS